MSFAENFKKARINVGLTQKQVADALGFDRTTIAQYERGFSEPQFKNIPKICKILKISLDDLITD